jgi:hypothetical protein
MAVALAFGVVGATFITLAMVPASYLILEDVKRVGLRLLGRTPASVSASDTALNRADSGP